MFNFKQFMFDKSLTQNNLSKIIGEQQSVISLLANGHRKPLKKHLDALAAEFGADVIEQYIIPDEVMQPKQTNATIIPFDAYEEIKEEVIAEEAIPVIPPEVSALAGCDVRAYVEEKGDELAGINPSQILGNADAAEKVLRSSMMPTFVPDDIVFIRFIKDKTKIVDGEIYYIDLKSRPTMIRKVKIDGDKLRLVALNPDYADIETTFADIQSVAIIVGLLRMSFTDVYGQMEDIRRRKEEQINKHIEQIDSLIRQVDKAGERESRLIEILETKYK